MRWGDLAAGSAVWTGLLLLLLHYLGLVRWP